MNDFTPLETDLIELLKDVEWSSTEMSQRMTAYFGLLIRRFGVGSVMAMTSFAELGLEAAAFIPTAAKLAALQQKDARARNTIYAKCWAEANGKPTPKGYGFKNWGVDIALEAAHRLRKEPV